MKKYHTRRTLRKLMETHQENSVERLFFEKLFWSVNNNSRLSASQRHVLYITVEDLMATNNLDDEQMFMLATWLNTCGD